MPDKANMIGRHAQALMRHAHVLVDSLQFAGEDEQDRQRHAVLSYRAKLLHQLLPLWLDMEVCRLSAYVLYEAYFSMWCCVFCGRLPKQECGSCQSYHCTCTRYTACISRTLASRRCWSMPRGWFVLPDDQAIDLFMTT